MSAVSLDDCAYQSGMPCAISLVVWAAGKSKFTETEACLADASAKFLAIWCLAGHTVSHPDGSVPELVCALNDLCFRFNRANRQLFTGCGPKFWAQAKLDAEEIEDAIRCANEVAADAP